MKEADLTVKDIKESFALCIKDSVSQRQLDVSEWAQNYVAALLELFVKSANFFDGYEMKEDGTIEKFLQPIAISYLEAQEKSQELKSHELKKIGDKCLFLTGFMYDHIQRNGLPQARYYGDIGSSAYIDVAHSVHRSNKEVKQLYFELARKFWDLSDVINDLRLSASYSNRTLMDILFKHSHNHDSRHNEILAKCGIILNAGKEKN